MLRTMASSMLAAAAVGGCVPAGAPAPPRSATELAGRTPGAPQKCVPTTRTEGLRYGGERTVLYGRGRTIWANRLSQRCSGLRPNHAFKISSIGAQYCRGDLLTSADPVSGTAGPGCFLDDFIPYRK